MRLLLLLGRTAGGMDQDKNPASLGRKLGPVSGCDSIEMPLAPRTPPNIHEAFWRSSTASFARGTGGVNMLVCEPERPLEGQGIFLCRLDIYSFMLASLVEGY